MSSGTHPERLKFTLFAAFIVIFSVVSGIYIGEQITKEEHKEYVEECEKALEFSENVTDVTRFISDVVLIFSSVMHSVDTARSTLFLLDEHSYIEMMISSVDDNISSDMKSTMMSRQTYFSNRTVSLLDEALKKATNLSPVGNVSESDLLLLRSKISEMKQLAIQLRTIAYKQTITESDLEEARAIVRNMENIAEDIYILSRKMIDDANVT